MKPETRLWVSVGLGSHREAHHTLRDAVGDLSLCVALTVADGVVMGTDSITIVREGSNANSYSSGVKLFELPRLPIAVMTFELAGFGRRSIASLIDEWSTQTQYDESYTVEKVMTDLGTWIFSKHRDYLIGLEADVERQQREQLQNRAGSPNGIRPFDSAEWALGLIVAGYEPGSFVPWVWQWLGPTRTGNPPGMSLINPVLGPNDEHDGSASGIEFWGIGRALSRLTQGYDAALLDAPVETKVIQPSKAHLLDDLIERFRWKPLTEGMPLQDGVELVRYLLAVGAGYEQFAHGSASVGGEHDIAVVTRTGIIWPALKDLTRRIYELPRASAPVRRPEPKTKRIPTAKPIVRGS